MAVMYSMLLSDFLQLSTVTPTSLSALRVSSACHYRIDAITTQTVWMDQMNMAVVSGCE